MVLIFPSLTLIEIGVVGERSLDPKAGDATTAAAGFGGAIGLGVVVGVSALGVGAGAGAEVGLAAEEAAAALETEEGAAALETVSVTEEFAVESAAADPAEELFDVHATAPASSPAVIPSRATRRPQGVIRAVILIVCLYGSCARAMLTPTGQVARDISTDA
jgi:hypothetical protein